ncbi:hypothetical protein HMPREF0083_05451 [Aneurinibacillus aneurinilyticus ATCC 12856]|uniref:Uncharacterized protein n=1 Tax=Aneurinibacillus aneurinilyticus ATCC 12856 TaxID=649747 RepID=U1WBH8_ANEAE|nr:hypothetical protein HMPREF0083_05451 [Aneurinibacillus aneurinilyticus ATCC 12856]
MGCCRSSFFACQLHDLQKHLFSYTTKKLGALYKQSTSFCILYTI